VQGRGPVGAAVRTAAAAAAILALAALRPAPEAVAYRSALDGLTVPISTPIVAGPDSALDALSFFDAIPGRLSLEGLPPIQGVLQLSPRAILFHPDDGIGPLYFPLFRQSTWARVPGRRPAIQLHSVDSAGASAVFMYHLDGAVFETRAPGALRTLGETSGWVDSLAGTVSSGVIPLVDPADHEAMIETVRTLAASSYADTLYRLFGAPDRPLGVVSRRGQAMGRLGEYVGSRDSVSLAPGAMIHPEQLRHGLAHELAHRWQRREKRELAAVWRGVSPIDDSLRYGYRSVSEHQAEAVAFAVHYLQTTARPVFTTGERLTLLESYERLVPGTRRLARHLLAQPVYAQHPLIGHSLAAPRVISIHGSCAGLETGRSAGAPGACSLIVTD
jgi:hypothetical protein